MSTEQFGVHLMLDIYDASPERLADESLLKQSLLDIPNLMGMHTICDPITVEVGSNNKKDPGGISGFVMIAESHISFHTFPNRKFVSVDVYTCQNDLDVNKFIDEFKKIFLFSDFDYYVQKRGLRYPSENLC